MPRTPKYYTYNKKHKLYQIKKRLGDDWKYFGYYKTQKEAEYVVDELKKVDWDFELLSDDLKKLIEPTFKHYSKQSNGKYTVIKTCNYESHNYGTYDTEEEAAEIEKLLEKNNWRLSNLSEEELSLIKLRKLTEFKFYYYNEKNDNWLIYNGKDYFGTYKDEETAIRVVEALKKVDWDKDKCGLDLDELRIKRPESKHYYYHKHSNKYQVKKQINGTFRSFGYYSTEEEAKQIVELLKQNNWNKECLV